MDESVKFLTIKPVIVQHCLSNLSNLVFEVTDACNLRCTYCGYSDLYSGYDVREDKFMSFDQAKAVIDYLLNFWKTNSSPVFTKRLNISFYGGEPLLNTTLIKKIIDYVEKQENLGRTLSYSMTTNGVLLDKHIDFLVEKQFSLLVSLDGDEYAQSYRVDKQGNNSFTQVFKNVKCVQDHYPDYFNAHVRFNSVLHNRNDIDPLYDFFDDQFAKAPKISPLNTDGVKKEKACMFDEICNNYGESFLKVKNIGRIEENDLMASPPLARFYRQFAHKSGNIYNDYRELLFDKEKTGIVPSGTCPPFAKKMFITVNGKILQCERIDHKYAIGAVRNNRVELDFDEIAKSHNKAIYKFISQCTSCDLKTYCNKCMYQLNTIHGSEETCLSYINDKHASEIDLSPLKTRPDLLHRILYKLKIR